MKPPPPAGSPHRCDMPPLPPQPLLSPSSSSAFLAAAEGDHEAAVPEKEKLCVMLSERWLATVEGDEQKVAVAGMFEWKQTPKQLPPTPIVKRLSSDCLEAEDGTILLITGFFSTERTLRNGYSSEVRGYFLAGFPYCWQNLRDPNLTKFDFEKQFRPYGSSLITGSPSRETGHNDIATDVSLAPTVECINNAFGEAAGSTPATGTYHKKTPVASLKSQCSWREIQHIASNKKPVVRPKKQISQHEKHQSATRSPVTKSAFSQVLGSPLTRSKAKSSSMSTPEGPKLKRAKSGMSLAVRSTNDAISEAPDSTQVTDRKKTPVSCLKNQGSQHVASNKKPVGRPRKQNRNKEGRFTPREEAQGINSNSRVIVPELMQDVKALSMERSN